MFISDICVLKLAARFISLYTEKRLFVEFE
jgi:hypothetical protein